MLAQNRPQLTSMLDEIFSSHPMSHWYEVFNGAQITFGAVRGPEEVVNDPQLRANDIVVPLEGAGEKLTSTISSPIQVHGVAKVPARRAPGIGEHNDAVLKELGFTSDDIAGLRTSGAVPEARHLESTAGGAR
jgi:formyl-CoA transferase